MGGMSAQTRSRFADVGRESNVRGWTVSREAGEFALSYIARICPRLSDVCAPFLRRYPVIRWRAAGHLVFSVWTV